MSFQQPLLLLANEVSSTIAVYAIQAGTATATRAGQATAPLAVYPNPSQGAAVRLSRPTAGTLCDLTGRVVVLDCVTLWLTNFFTDAEYDVEAALRQAQQEFDKLRQQDCTLLVISNEIGMGLHAPTEAGRKFTDLQG